MAVKSYLLEGCLVNCSLKVKNLCLEGKASITGVVLHKHQANGGLVNRVGSADHTISNNLS